MTKQQAAAPSAQAPTIPELWTMAEVAKTLGRTRAGVDKLRARDPQFPKPLKDGTDRRSRIYFVRQEIEAYLAARLAAREVAA
ncbi:transcriptional regulator, AlpA family [Azotobacter beijerinckii]|uniref:Transcriptional regulator, AlpA family n=1 Tax=Azotobacter beijerinckii TaxID=170623 RepID=A0A1H9S302_9GAMM|nr:transcriptional regulator [Azotobacter beijerinckii]SER79446.1 transcriptional regulator, AlpA family [Azotobacter beijerinckii]